MAPAHDVRIVARGALAGVACEALLAALVLALLQATRGTLPALLPCALFALGGGLVAGAAWGVAEAVARRITRPAPSLAAGAAAGLLLALLAPLAGLYAMGLALGGGPVQAARWVVAAVTPVGAGPVLVFATGALCLHGPLLWARRTGEGLGREALAMSLGLVAWLAALLFVGGPFEVLSLSLYLALLLPRVALFPLALRGADRVTSWVSRSARGVSEDAPPARAARARARTPSAVERHRARLLDDRGREHLEAGRPAEAAADLAQAHALWPTAERALVLARAHAGALSTDAALAALEDAAALAGGRPAGLDGAAPEWAPLRDHARLDAVLALPPARPGGPRARGALLLAPCWALTLLLAAAAPAALTPADTAEVTRLRLRAALRGGAAWRALGLRLERESPAVAAGLWQVDALARNGLAHDAPPDLESAARAHVRAAEAGDAHAMSDAARVLSWLPDRQPEAVTWARRAAETRDPEAMWRWGSALRSGWCGVTPDDAEGRAWWERAAAAGHGPAMLDLARWHARNEDLEAARAWFRRAEQAGLSHAAREREDLDRPVFEEPEAGP